MRESNLLIAACCVLILYGGILALTAVPYILIPKEITKSLQLSFGNRLPEMVLQEAGKKVMKYMWVECVLGSLLIICGSGLLRMKEWARRLVLILSSLGSIYLIYRIYLDIFIRYRAPFPIFKIAVLTFLIFLIILLNLKNIKNLFIG